MPESSEQYRVAVGFDGSEGARCALGWAVDEARRRGGVLVAIRAWTPGEFGTDVEMGKIAENKLRDEVFQVLGDQEHVPLEFAAIQGHAGRVLVEASAGADMMVVGARARAGLARLLGSVSEHVAAHSDAAVTVIVRQ